MNIIGIIPARYASSRFPGKPLIDIAGKPMIQRVCEQVAKSKLLTKHIVATDDTRIYNAVTELGFEAMLTSPNHVNGTERCAEVIQNLNESFDYAINIQGDEPFIQPSQIDELANLLVQKNAALGTLKKKITDADMIQNPSIIKVVSNTNQEALYFSRSPIPFDRDGKSEATYYKHIGIYGYNINTLKEIVKLPPSLLELTESLEQLRWLENGYTIHIQETNFESKSIDTPADLEYVLTQIHQGTEGYR